VLELMKILLGIESDSKDQILNFFIEKAKAIIISYCAIDEITSNLETAVVSYAIYLYRNRDSEGILSQVQGSRSVSYEQSIPSSILLALPKPKVTVGG